MNVDDRAGLSRSAQRSLLLATTLLLASLTITSTAMLSALLV